MRVLLIGSGGRESALAWALGRSPLLTELTCAPGNAGIARHARRVPIGAEDVGALAAHAIAERYDLVVVGPEAPLVGGLADRLRDAGVPVFGPSAAAAVIEGSKAFSKAFMARHEIPTAAFRVFHDPEDASRYLRAPQTPYPLVVKADGLAAGKGVVIAEEREAALEAAGQMLSGRAFGEAGRAIVVEERLAGREMSYFVLADGEAFVELAPCRDFKRAGDGDLGPNTGGMGTFSPAPGLDEASRDLLVETVVRPTVRGLASEGRAFRGVLFIGLMLTDRGPKVLEYNARFGDPETQVLVPRLHGDWLPLLLACAEGRLGGRPRPEFRREAAVCVVMASAGYPGAYTKGRPIHGVEAAEEVPGVVVFHAGTELDASGRLVTAGGRVLGVTATGRDLRAARDAAYRGVSEIHWDGEHHRRDIAAEVIATEDRDAG